MVETLGVAALLVLMVLLGLASAAPAPWVLMLGLGLMVVGLAVGIPAGLYYHVKLYRALSPRAALEPRWWLRPLQQHRELHETERLGVLVWCAIGGAGFGMILLGALVFAVGIWRYG